MAEVCGASHPDHPEVTCEKTRPCYITHLNHSISPPDWDNDAKPPTTKSRRVEVDKLSEKVKQERYTGPPTSTIRESSSTKREDGPGPIKDPEWVEQTTRLFQWWLTQRTKPFTTAEDFWPHVEAPSEMREMVHVVRHALREEWITEVGSKRLKGLYRTKDGTEFKMNKLVPIYQSQIVASPKPPADHDWD